MRDDYVYYGDDITTAAPTTRHHPVQRAGQAGGDLAAAGVSALAGQARAQPSDDLPRQRGHRHCAGRPVSGGTPHAPAAAEGSSPHPPHGGRMTTPTYETDFYAWTQAQATALRAKDWPVLDVDNLAEELEGMARSDRRALGNHLKNL